MLKYSSDTPAFWLKEGDIMTVRRIVVVGPDKDTIKDATKQSNENNV